MSVVYLAKDPRLERSVAIKVLSDELADDQSFRSRFVRESQLAAGLDHPNIVPVYEAGEIEGKLFIAMRYVRGTDLRTLVSQEGSLPTERTLRLLRPIASALDAAHRAGLVHRDVKPANILVARDQEEEHPYLSDFGSDQAHVLQERAHADRDVHGHRGLRGARTDPGWGGRRTRRRVLARVRAVPVPDRRGAVRQGHGRRDAVRPPAGSAAADLGSSPRRRARAGRGGRARDGEGTERSPPHVHGDDRRRRARDRYAASLRGARPDRRRGGVAPAAARSRRWTRVPAAGHRTEGDRTGGHRTRARRRRGGEEGLAPAHPDRDRRDRRRARDRRGGVRAARRWR